MAAINWVTWTDYEPPAFGPDKIGFANLTHCFNGITEETLKVNTKIAHAHAMNKSVSFDFGHAIDNGSRKIIKQNYLDAGWKKVQWSQKGSILKLFK